MALSNDSLPGTVQLGWKCPVCGVGNAPWSRMCGNCVRQATSPVVQAADALWTAVRNLTPESNGALIEAMVEYEDARGLPDAS